MTFLKCSNILLFFIFTIVIVNPSVAQDSPIIPDTSHVSMRLQDISQLESPGGRITHRFPPNISMGDIGVARLDNLSRDMYVIKRSTNPVNVSSDNASANIGYLPRAYNTATVTTTGSVHNINKGTEYTTIQAAIDNASTGDEIQVDNGTYYENVNVTKQLILRGIGMPVVYANGGGNAVTLAADGIVLEGFSATNAEVGIKVTSNNNTLSGNNASNNGDYGLGTGISLSSSNNNTLGGNNANWNNGFEFFGCGISLISSNKNTLRDCRKITYLN